MRVEWFENIKSVGVVLTPLLMEAIRRGQGGVAMIPFPAESFDSSS
jgi:hypothetical protein